jgi:hypothetical protein
MPSLGHPWLGGSIGQVKFYQPLLCPRFRQIKRREGSPREFFTLRLISFLPSQLLLCGIGLWQSGRRDKPGGPPRGPPPSARAAEEKPQPEAGPLGFSCGGCQGKPPVDSLPVVDPANSRLFSCCDYAPLVHRRPETDQDRSVNSRLAAVSREQLRQGSALSNRHFDFTTSEVYATIKLRTGAMG